VCARARARVCTDTAALFLDEGTPIVSVVNKDGLQDAFKAEKEPVGVRLHVSVSMSVSVPCLCLAVPVPVPVSVPGCAFLIFGDTLYLQCRHGEYPLLARE
jgi:hypothetical protein